MNPGKMVWIAGLVVAIGMCGCRDGAGKNKDKQEQRASRSEVEQMLDELREHQRRIIALQLDGANGFQDPKNKRNARNCTSFNRLGNTAENYRRGSLGFRLAFVPID